MFLMPFYKLTITEKIDFIGKPINWTLLGHRVLYVCRAGQILMRLRQSEAKLAEAQRIARLGSWEWRPAAAAMQCTAEVGRIFGLADGLDRIDLATIRAALHPDDRPSFAADLDRAVTGGGDLAADYRLLLGDGAERVIAANARVERPAGGGTVVKGTFQDVTEHREAAARLHFLAHHDSLTGLPNRLLFHDRLNQALARSRRDGCEVAVLCLDVARFKDINDSLGHVAGDALLRELAQRLQNEIRGSDTVARLGGDEFAIIQIGVGQPANAESLAQRLLAAVIEPFDAEGHEVFADISLGVALGRTDGDDAERLLIKADMALYRAKGEGRGVCRFYEEGMDESSGPASGSRTIFAGAWPRAGSSCTTSRRWRWTTAGSSASKRCSGSGTRSAD
jgi:diguanylate cyclase (GGDEF)-like protein